MPNAAGEAIAGPPATARPVARVSSAFERLAAALRDGGQADAAPAAPSRGRRGFGAAALTVDGKIFAMPVRGAPVIKLPRERVAALVAAGVGAPYDPGRGRVMREWVVLGGSEAHWLSLAREAHAFVAAGAPRR